MREKTCKNEQDARIRIKKKALTPFPIRCERSYVDFVFENHNCVTWILML